MKTIPLLIIVIIVLLRKKISKLVGWFFYVSLLIFISLAIRIFENIVKKRVFPRNKIIFGSTPIKNNKYWCEALRKEGYDVETFMTHFYSSINKKEDFDKYFDDVIPPFFKKKHYSRFFWVWLHIIKNAKILVRSFDFIYPFEELFTHSFFSPFLQKLFMFIELILLKINDIKVIVLPYGADSYMYSRVKSKLLQNALIISYPEFAKREKEIEYRVFWWSKHADLVITGLMTLDGFPRWDVCMPQFVVIDTDLWKRKKKYGRGNGKEGLVKILHTPNHRGFKGTEYIINAVEELRKEGLKVELVLLEGVQNDKVREIMEECDMLVEQLICPGYALSGIEGMAKGLVVISNLDEPEEFRKLFSKYSFLGECPIVSANIWNVKEKLRELIENPDLREELGRKGREYVEKYHSYKTFVFLFENILKKLEGKEVNLINLFHPLNTKGVNWLEEKEAI